MQHTPLQFSAGGREPPGKLVMRKSRSPRARAVNAYFLIPLSGNEVLPIVQHCWYHSLPLKHQYKKGQTYYSKSTILNLLATHRLPTILETL